MKQKDEIELVRYQVTDAQVFLLEDFNLISDFFNYELSNPQFYESGQSSYIVQHQKKQEQIRFMLIQLMERGYVKSEGIDTLLYAIINQSLEYSNSVAGLVSTQRQRGFKDFGVEGKMREAIHAIEKRSELSMVDVLMLRRHEKDFIIRKDMEYVVKLHLRAQEMSLHLMANSSIAPKRKEEILTLLNSYTFYFDQIVGIENQLGLKSPGSLKNRFDNQANHLHQMFTNVVKIAKEKEDRIITQMHVIMVIIIACIVTASILLSFWLSRRITWRLSLLAETMQQFVDSDFEQLPDTLPLDEKTDETAALIANYRTMRSKMILLIYDFKRSVQERVQEIEYQKTRIEVQNEEITSQRDELFRQFHLIEEQRVLVEKQNHEILDSIRYAAGIQNALMPDKQTISSVFPEHFIYYLPLGIVSGDFYWVNQIVKDDVKYSVLIAADCTGHGVPGALMSMLGISYLNELVVRQQIVCPNVILRSLQQNVIGAMQRKAQKQKIVDGMEIGIAVINESTRVIQFAGANRSLYMVRNEELLLLQADKRPIGESLLPDIQFTIHTHNLIEGDCLYLFTDGFSDQFGGANNKKYTKRALTQFLHTNAHKPMTQQFEAIDQEFSQWKGNLSQIDDVLVMGVRIS